jgi:hypothetical protein
MLILEFALAENAVSGEVIRMVPVAATDDFTNSRRPIGPTDFAIILPPVYLVLEPVPCFSNNFFNHADAESKGKLRIDISLSPHKHPADNSSSGNSSLVRRMNSVSLESDIKWS